MLSPTVEGVNFSTEIDSSSLFSELTDTPQKEVPFNVAFKC